MVAQLGTRLEEGENDGSSETLPDFRVVFKPGNQSTELIDGSRDRVADLLERACSVLFRDSERSTGIPIPLHNQIRQRWLEALRVMR
jgi:hypothetical protein